MLVVLDSITKMLRIAIDQVFIDIKRNTNFKYVEYILIL